MITLYRGDDTTFKGVKRLRVTIESKTSLAGCSATFEVCGVVKHVPDVSTGSFYLSLTGEDTAKMPLGTHTATLRVYDDESRRRTVANTIMVCVTERIGDAYPGEEEVAVSLGAMVEWRNVADKPSVNGVVLEGNKTTKDLGIKGVVEAELVDLPEDYTPDGLRAAVNAINACLRASMACLAAAACLLFAPCAAWADEAESAATDATEGETTESPSRVTVREFGDMTSMGKQFKALSNLTAVVTAVDLEGLATEDALKEKVAAEASARLTADAALAEAVAGKADASALAAHTGDKANPHGVTAEQVGALTAESDPAFAAWTNGTALVAGQGASVSNPVAVALGYGCVANGGTSAAVGVGNEASGIASSAFGYGNTASGGSSLAFGYQNTASGKSSSAFGYRNTASGKSSSAFGYYNKANTDYSSALGYNNTASGIESFAFGLRNSANGDGSTALGYLAYTAPAWTNSLAVSQTPDLIYLGSSTTNNGATARTLQAYLDEKATLAQVKAAISATDATFSNAVLAVATQWNTNTVAEINALLAEGAELPTSGVVTVGAALAALAAGLAALKKSLAATDAKVSAANANIEEVA